MFFAARKVVRTMSKMRVLLAWCLAPKLTRARPFCLREGSDRDQSCVCVCACPLIQPSSPFFRVVTQRTTQWCDFRVITLNPKSMMQSDTGITLAE
jgi:hypothetical protein